MLKKACEENDDNDDNDIMMSLSPPYQDASTSPRPWFFPIL